MEKETKREFTDAEVLAIVKCCRDMTTGCGVCPANVPKGACTDAYAQSIDRLVEMYEEKCKELKEWQESHARCIKDIRERGEREVHLDELVRSYQDQYIKSRVECDKLHAEIRDLVSENEELDKTRQDIYGKFCEQVDIIDKLHEENEELKTANKHLIQLRDEYRAAMPRLTEANNNLRAENDDLNAQVKSLSDKFAEYESENKNLRETLCKYIHALTDKRQECDLLKDANAVLKEKVAKYMRKEKSSFDEIKEKLENSKFVPIEPVSSGCTDTLELMKMADFWKGQYEATKKLLDETNTKHQKAFHECAETELRYERAIKYRDDQLKKQPKEIAVKIISIINEPFMYRFTGNLKRYTEKDVIDIVDKVLADFRVGLINSIKMEEFYGK